MATRGRAGKGGATNTSARTGAAAKAKATDSTAPTPRAGNTAPSPAASYDSATAAKSGKGGNVRTSPAVASAAQQNAGGIPQGSTAGSAQQIETQNRLQLQRDQQAARERTELAMAARPEGAAHGNIFTAVVRNGLNHRRCGILFGADPTTVDTSGWTEEEKQRFFNDSLLMIVPGRHLNAGGSILAPEASFPAFYTGGSGENATPEMLNAMERGLLMRHPAAGPAGGPVGAGVAPAVRDLEQIVNGKGDGESGGKSDVNRKGSASTGE